MSELNWKTLELNTTKSNLLNLEEPLSPKEMKTNDEKSAIWMYFQI